MFNLKSVLTPQAEKTHNSYSVTGVHPDGRIQTTRDNGKSVVFTPARLQELLAAGKLTQTSDTSFDLLIDKDFNPNAGFVAL